jgi:hypothetical protein
MQTRSKSRREKEILLVAEAATTLLPPNHVLNSPLGSTPRPPGYTPGNCIGARIVADETLKYIADLEFKIENCRSTTDGEHNFLSGKNNR